jgi:diguanylate cyclase (GGDEF)-like protein
LVRDQDEKLTAKAAIGARIDLEGEPDLGGRVARSVLENARPIMVIDAARASLPPTPPDRNYRTSSFISYPVVLGDRAVGVLSITDKAGEEHFDIRDAAALDSIVPQIAVAIDRMTLREKAGEYQQLSITDPLTGLLNRRYIEERLAEEINRSQRSGEPLSLLMLDVDEFKSYNDRFGHPAGDEALRIVGRILKENLRGADVAARYGGEEFSVLLPATSGEEAAAIAERIRRHAEETKFPKRRVTLSIGISSLSADVDTSKKLIDAADKALYQAKQNGRNGVHTYRGPALDPGEQVH